MANSSWQKGTGTSRGVVFDIENGDTLGASPLLPQAPKDATSRRDFLKTTASFVALGATVPAFLQQTVEAATRGNRRRFQDGERILVVVQLAGGNDGLNTVVPVTNDVYYRLRPKLALQAADTLALNDDFALHGQAVGLKQLYDAGLLGILHAVGYPNPDRSHFKSMDIWHTASPEGRWHDGWLGRYFDHTCKGSDPCDPADGIALMPESPLAMRGDRFLPLAFEKPESLGWNAATRPRPTGQVVTAMNQPQPGDPRQPETALEFLRRVALDARLSAEQIQQATRNRPPRANFPRSAIGQSLRTVSQLIGAGLRTRVYYVSHGGYDTHAQQTGRQANLLRDLGEALAAFLQALKAQGDLDRVLVMSFSEFGRRVAENGSAGTDHGAGSVMFVAGGKVVPGLHGTPPDLANLDHGDVRFSTDFRSVYATVLDEWLGVAPARILGGEFPHVGLLKTR